MSEIKTSQPLEIKVDPRKWTTKVNVAVVVAVLAVLLIGACYAIYAALNSDEVQSDLHEEVTVPPAPNGG